MNPFYLVGLAQTLTNELVANSSNSSDCPQGNQIIWNTFEQCIYTPLQWASFAVGMASIAFWLGVLMPQIVDNFKDMKGVASISAGLLFSWIFGDTTNLVGAFLTKQGLFQVLLGVWFVMTDLILSSQLIYYHLVYKKREQRAAIDAGTEPRRLVLCLAGLLGTSVGLSSIQGFMQPQPAVGSVVVRGRQLLSSDPSSDDEPFLKDPQVIIGYVFGIVSTVAYFMSRSFQIYKNVTQRNVKGLSTVTFVMAVLGNLLYGLAIVLYSVQLHYTLMHLPWLLGSWGIMFMDCFIVFQIKTYCRDEDSQTLIVPVPEEDERRPLISSINCSPADNVDYGAGHTDRVVV